LISSQVRNLFKTW